MFTDARWDLGLPALNEVQVKLILQSALEESDSSSLSYL